MAMITHSELKATKGSEELFVHVCSMLQSIAQWTKETTLGKKSQENENI